MNAKFCLAAMGLAVALGGCAGGGPSLVDPNQVVVRVEDNQNVEGAIQVAQETCARRGGRARLVAVVNQNVSFRHRNFEQRPPDAVFTCDPVR
jgi:hypothetical protein